MTSRIRWALDLELEQPKSNPDTPDSMLDIAKTIQIGAVFFNVDTGEVVHRFMRHIKPKYEIKLSKFIKELTNITDEEVANGIDIYQAYEELVAKIKEYDCIKRPITWGTGDLDKLQEDACSVQLGFGESNTKALYQDYAHLNGRSRKVGLQKAMGKCGLVFHGRAHDALVDAENTAQFWLFLMNKLKGR